MYIFLFFIFIYFLWIYRLQMYIFPLYESVSLLNTLISMSCYDVKHPLLCLYFLVLGYVSS